MTFVSWRQVAGFLRASGDTLPADLADCIGPNARHAERLDDESHDSVPGAGNRRIEGKTRW